MRIHLKSRALSLIGLSAAFLACVEVEQPQEEHDVDAHAPRDVASKVDLRGGATPHESATHDFIVSELNFYFPEGLVSTEEEDNPCGLEGFTDNTSYEPLALEGLAVEGFDLDGEDTQGEGPCAHTDFVSPLGEAGIDYAFIHVIDMIRPARPGQTIELVLASAALQGLVKIGLRLSGVDDLDEDEEVDVLVTTTQDTPLLGTDGEIIAGSSVAADDDETYRTRLKGRIEGGILHAGPADITMGKVDLLVVQDRVFSLKGTMLRATLDKRPDGLLDLAGLLSGWWEGDDMIEAIGQAVLTIGANEGELECVLERHMDHALKGESCDAMSMIFRLKAVSGFITGLDEAEAQGGGP